MPEASATAGETRVLPFSKWDHNLLDCTTFLALNGY